MKNTTTTTVNPKRYFASSATGRDCDPAHSLCYEPQNGQGCVACQAWRPSTVQTFHVAYESSPTLPTTAEDIDTLDIISFRCRAHETTATLRNDAGDVVGLVATDGRATDVCGFTMK